MKHNNDITILTQAFYGNRTMVRVPGTENLVLVYNKFQEEECLERLREFVQDLRGNTYRMNPTAVIPELGIVLFSRCFVCRVNNAGDPISLEEEDMETVLPYLAS